MAAITTDASGDNVFLALDNSSSTFPTVVMAARSDLSTFTVAYEPGAGTACNAIPDPANVDVMYFYGNFGTDLTITKYTISTDTTADISPASLGAKVINTLIVDPSNNSEMICTVDTDQDLKNTIDAGVTWTDWDAALGFDATALAALWSGPYFLHRYFVGGEVSGGNLDLLYSPNEGAAVSNEEGTALGALGEIVSIEVTEA